MIKVAPSILSADFANLGRDIASAVNCRADYIHFDVMDGNFVPNLSFGLPVLRDVRRITELPLDVHLMIDRPVRYVEAFCDAGADIVTVHVEADSIDHTRDALLKIQARGKRPAVCLKPGTPAEAAVPFLELCSLVLVMTVEPGFGGQSFMADMMPKVTALRRLLDQRNPSCELEVDGGVNLETGPVCASAGADVFVAGSAFFKADNRAAFVEAIHAIENESGGISHAVR